MWLCLPQYQYWKSIRFSAVDCGALSFPLNGSSYGGSTTFPNSVHFSCDLGFILHGSSKRTCMATGSWSGIATTCTGKWKLKKHLKQPWTGNPFTHTCSFTTQYSLTPTLIYSLVRRARRNCCLQQRLELYLAKEHSSELFRGNFLVISKFYPLRYLSLTNRHEELLFLWELFCIHDRCIWGVGLHKILTLFGSYISWRYRHCCICICSPLHRQWDEIHRRFLIHQLKKHQFLANHRDLL